ncbi:transposase [Clostridium sp. MCC353]|uniref:HTH domain-containing protein n=1 Tax=Clostridium sp. MCC353 TaxID=2592646 RepID=UPI001C023881|nr:HTH domain-containing protein [Clostridium sp. MCC353]MBT9778031.1 transposase [Clostridium sp. MCC353]
MSRKPFTNEQILMLRQNPYTYSVTQFQLHLTKEFKEIFYSEYQAGELPRKILEDHGYDPAVLGERRIWSISRHIREQYKKYRCFREGNHTLGKEQPQEQTRDIPVSEKEELKQLRHEIDYLKQEVEFLKKISAVRITGK